MSEYISGSGTGHFAADNPFRNKPGMVDPSELQAVTMERDMLRDQLAATQRDLDRAGQALELIASCDRVVDGDVVDIARDALLPRRNEASS